MEMNTPKQDDPSLSLGAHHKRLEETIQSIRRSEDLGLIVDHFRASDKNSFFQKSVCLPPTFASEAELPTDEPTFNFIKPIPQLEEFKANYTQFDTQQPHVFPTYAEIVAQLGRELHEEHGLEYDPLTYKSDPLHPGLVWKQKPISLGAATNLEDQTENLMKDGIESQLIYIQRISDIIEANQSIATYAQLQLKELRGNWCGAVNGPDETNLPVERFTFSEKKYKKRKANPFYHVKDEKKESQAQTLPSSQEDDAQEEKKPKRGRRTKAILVERFVNMTRAYADIDPSSRLNHFRSDIANWVDGDQTQLSKVQKRYIQELEEFDQFQLQQAKDRLEHLLQRPAEPSEIDEIQASLENQRRMQIQVQLFSEGESSLDVLPQGP